MGKLLLGVLIAYALLAKTGLERPPSPSTDIRDTLQQDGQTRTYMVHVPTELSNSTKSIPLVIALHGGGGSGQQFATQSKWSEKADQEGFVVVYPDGRQNPGVLSLRSWNAGGCCGQIASVQHTDDVGFIRKLIDKLVARYRIDPKRIYATGHSNGAMLCYRLACELSDKVAAIAPNAGTLQVQTPCHPERVMPILHVHSKQDQNVPYLGGVGTKGISGHWNPSVDSTLSVFANLAGCTAQKQTLRMTDTYTQYQWISCQKGADIQYYLTADGGHSWPGGMKSARFASDMPSQAFVNNDLIWSFFKTRSLP